MKNSDKLQINKGKIDEFLHKRFESNLRRVPADIIYDLVGYKGHGGGALLRTRLENLMKNLGWEFSWHPRKKGDNSPGFELLSFQKPTEQFVYELAIGKDERRKPELFEKIVDKKNADLDERTFSDMKQITEEELNKRYQGNNSFVYILTTGIWKGTSGKVGRSGPATDKLRILKYSEGRGTRVGKHFFILLWSPTLNSECVEKGLRKDCCVTKGNSSDDRWSGIGKLEELYFPFRERAKWKEHNLDFLEWHSSDGKWYIATFEELDTQFLTAVNNAK